MNIGQNEENNEFLFEEVERYKISIFLEDKGSYTTSNDIDYLKSIYDNIIEENIENNKHIVISIYDFDKNTNIYYYDSEQERC